uniref:Uncharacterized protein n=1 Tax=Solanum lycopersicum TaxID=4081 RepID=A0A3Q7IWD0_SOLLC
MTTTYGYHDQSPSIKKNLSKSLRVFKNPKYTGNGTEIFTEASTSITVATGKQKILSGTLPSHAVIFHLGWFHVSISCAMLSTVQARDWQTVNQNQRLWPPQMFAEGKDIGRIQTSVSGEVFCSQAATRTNRKMVYTIEISEYHLLLYV